MKSMTGFARIAGGDDEMSWEWDLRSVNNKALDIRSRIPSLFDDIELKAKKQAQTAVRRGSLTLNFQYSWGKRTTQYALDAETLSAALGAIEQIETKLMAGTSTSAVELLKVPGIWVAQDQVLNEDVAQARSALILEDLKRALKELVRVRQEEGQALFELLSEQIASMLDLVKCARLLDKDNAGLVKEKLLESIKPILADNEQIDPVRLHQEVVLLASKADIREELDRLKIHLEQAYDLIKSDDPVGRRLDFLCQELNREANTLCSKSKQVELTQIGMDLKTIIEQFREQIQNVE